MARDLHQPPGEVREVGGGRGGGIVCACSGARGGAMLQCSAVKVKPVEEVREGRALERGP